MSEDTSLPPEAAVFMAFTATVAAAVASIFIAVPVMVWSALKLMAATASNSEKTRPNRALTMTVVMTMTGAPTETGMNFSTRAPPRAPMTMMPSRPMLITPLRSAKQPPKATSIRTDAKIKVYWMSSVICPRPLPEFVRLLRLFAHRLSAAGSG